ncbi:helix-turn-helix domain-containing protein [Rubrolithibacter danxiaensis]|uniref:helix-turn-helix domain-containing protein n=1 Tax=Rubrolithibacter danxiaensis TaxID=3390805 RepID=UPI003BF7F1DA
MLYFSLKPVFKLRGIHNPYNLLVKAGISSHSASSLLNSDLRSMRLDHLEKVCILLNCTPNDLLTWVPDSDSKLEEDHPLAELKPKTETVDLYLALKKLPLSELKKVAGLIQDAK